MHFLKSNLPVFLLAILTDGCATSSYKVEKQDHYFTEISASPNRITIECEPIDNYSGNTKDPHGFMIHVLDEQDTVLNLIVEPVLSKPECHEHLSNSMQVIKTGKEIHIIGGSNLESPREKSDSKYSFPELGTFYGNGRVLKFRTVWNEHGQCYNVFYGKQKPCPRDEFK